MISQPSGVEIAAASGLERACSYKAALDKIEIRKKGQFGAGIPSE